MAHTITVPGKGQFSVSTDENIMEAGQRAGFRFPHACRNGNCERCLATLDSGQVAYPGKLGERLRARHGDTALLCCQARPLSDCTLHMENLTAPGELPVQEQTCQVVELQPLNHDVSLIRLRLPAGKPAAWYAGQYLQLRLGERWVPFSIANAPTAGLRDIELHYRHLGHHASSQARLTWLQSRELVRARLPLGQCHLATLPDRPLWFICGSTGIAPAKAMLEYLAKLQYTGELRLFWGAREAVDFYLPDLPEQLLARLPGLHADLVLSDQSLPHYHHGLVHECALAALTDPALPQFFVSGSPAMAEVTWQALRRAGVDDQRIHSDMLSSPHLRAAFPAP